MWLIFLSPPTWWLLLVSLANDDGGAAASSPAAGFLDLDELKASFYSVRISDTPIVTESFTAEKETVHVASKYGQKYVCHYQRTPSNKPEDSEEKIAEMNITDILEPMRGNCLTKTKDWWTYEFCYGQVIEQFHLHNGKKSGDTVVIGKYESDKRWLPEDLAQLKKSTVNRYHTQSYVNGSLCDLTKKPRKAEVRFSCVEGEVDRIGAVAEMEACSYIIFVYTSKICHHPYLRPPVQATASAIECQPLVSQATYNRYSAELQARTNMADEKINTEHSVTEGEDEGDKKMDSSDSLLKGFTKGAGHEDTATDDTPAESGKLADNVFTGKLEEQKKILLEMLAEAMIGKGGRKTVAKYKDKIREYVSSQFDEIIAEAKSELDQGDEVSDNQDIQKLKDIMSSVLDSQLRGLEELETSSEEISKKPGSDAAEAEEGLTDSKKSKDKPEPKLAKPQPKTPEEIKIEFLQPQKLEVEMIDIDDIDESSVFYNTAKKAKKQQAETDNNQLKTVIAILRPMQEKGTRQEEKKQQQLQQNYGKRWDEPHDEL